MRIAFVALCTTFLAACAAFAADPAIPDQVSESGATLQSDLGATCDPTTDTDCDGVPDSRDNCRYIFNPDQRNNDGDAFGDACDTDDDNDGIPDTGGGGANPCPTADTCGTTFTCTNSGRVCTSDAQCTGGSIADTCIVILGTCAIGGGSCVTSADCPVLPDVCRSLCLASSARCQSNTDCVVSGCDDNCQFIPNPTQADSDADGVGDACDNCPTTPNRGQSDIDQDGVGDACDPDADGDGILTSGFPTTCSIIPPVSGPPPTPTNCNDNCPFAYNPSQFDSDGDRVGTVCDNCITVANPTQADADQDSVGDACDNCPTAPNPTQSNGMPPDDDAYGDACDNCPNTSNPTQADRDFDGAGDACDICLNDYDPGAPDADGDGIPNACDRCPGDAVPDRDGDNVCTSNDNCPLTPNPDQADQDGDGIGDLCDCDADGDGALDKLGYPTYPFLPVPIQVTVNCFEGPCLSGLAEAVLLSHIDYRYYPSCGNAFGGPWTLPCCLDNCGGLFNPGQANEDHDIAGAACDPDDNDPTVPTGLPANFERDGDGLMGIADNCPEHFNVDQADLDNDGVGDACDPDADGDLVADARDNCLRLFNPGQADTDGDQVGDLCDNCPYELNPEQADRNQNGVGDRCDLADDLILLFFRQNDQLRWQQETGFDEFILVSGSLNELRATGNYLQQGPLAQVRCAAVGDWPVGPLHPGPGGAVFFLAGGKTSGVQNGFGKRANGSLRINVDVCPAGGR